MDARQVGHLEHVGSKDVPVPPDPVDIKDILRFAQGPFRGVGSH